jgi:hypothetical protein
VLCPRGSEQRGLRPRRKLIAVEHELPDRLADRRAAGLAGREHLAALRAQPGRQELRLRALAGAVEAFERDEHANP